MKKLILFFLTVLFIGSTSYPYSFNIKEYAKRLYAPKNRKFTAQAIAYALPASYCIGASSIYVCVLYAKAAEKIRLQQAPSVMGGLFFLTEAIGHAYAGYLCIEQIQKNLTQAIQVPNHASQNK